MLLCGRKGEKVFRFLIKLDTGQGEVAEQVRAHADKHKELSSNLWADMRADKLPVHIHKNNLEERKERRKEGKRGWGREKEERQKAEDGTSIQTQQILGSSAPEISPQLLPERTSHSLQPGRLSHIWK